MPLNQSDRENWFLKVLAPAMRDVGTSEITTTTTRIQEEKQQASAD
jgi:hypothetical protein